MKMSLYPKLAWDGVRKNKCLYRPYILTCSGMVMMFYIIHYLAAIPELLDMAGGSTIIGILGFGTWIVALFALIFLFYTNSFLIRRRQKEFGLYNILGMGKGNLSVLLLWETVLIFCLSMGVGLFCGILFSKLTELCLVWVLREEVNYVLTVNTDVLKDTFLIFVVIFFLILLKSLWYLWHMSAVSLIRSENTGEKPPKANYLFGIGGFLILAGAYYISVTIENPLSALSWFFIAVGMVIVATYMLFISGSVVLCKLLQKNKRYYYNPNHFVSVSSMAYRMKRNGAGLASICILSTMVLVMMMGAGSLYFGTEDIIHARYPKDISVSVDYLIESTENQYSEEKEEFFSREMESLLDQYGVQPTNAHLFMRTSVIGVLYEGKLSVDSQSVNSADKQTMDHVTLIHLISLSSYNRSMGTKETLEEDEVLIQCVRRSYENPIIELSNGTVWNVKKHVDSVMESGNTGLNMIPAVFLIVDDIGKAIDLIRDELDNMSQENLFKLELTYSFDTDLAPNEQIMLAEAIQEKVMQMNIDGECGFYSCLVECRAAERADFYGTYGGIFSLGIILSIVFLLATVLIIYYKQVSEGYEDKARFGIMRKVGMTTKDIRRSINSQMLTVFSLPLITATVHISFAFPIVQKLLALFKLQNIKLFLVVTGVSVLVFGIIYALVYRITSNAYYSIVSGAKET